MAEVIVGEEEIAGVEEVEGEEIEMMLQVIMETVEMLVVDGQVEILVRMILGENLIMPPLEAVLGVIIMLKAAHKNLGEAGAVMRPVNLIIMREVAGVIKSQHLQNKKIMVGEVQQKLSLLRVNGAVVKLQNKVPQNMRLLL